MSSAEKISAVLLGIALLSFFGTTALPQQRADQGWSPSVSDPEFGTGDGPAVLVDAGHGNFHTIEGRYAPFAELLRLDGYQVSSTDVAVSSEVLRRADVFVISNAVLGGEEARWILPTPPAFEAEEVATIVEWVGEGGSLLLIADHMPFPGATAALADEFGIVFINGYAMKSTSEGGVLSFDRASGLLADHPVTLGRTWV